MSEAAGFEWEDPSEEGQIPRVLAHGTGYRTKFVVTRFPRRGAFPDGTPGLWMAFPPSGSPGLGSRVRYSFDEVLKDLGPHLKAATA